MQYPRWNWNRSWLDDFLFQRKECRYSKLSRGIPDKYVKLMADRPKIKFYDPEWGNWDLFIDGPLRRSSRYKTKSRGKVRELVSFCNLHSWPFQGCDLCKRWVWWKPVWNSPDATGAIQLFHEWEATKKKNLNDAMRVPSWRFRWY